MLKKFLILASFILFTYSSFACVRGAGEMVVEWEYPYNISNDHDTARSVAVDSENNIIVVGVDQKPGNMEWRIIKFDKEGNEVWNKSFDPNETEDDRAYAVAIDSQDNIIVVGDR